MIKKNHGHGDYFETSDGGIQLWVEDGGSYHLKIVGSPGDPTDWSEGEALDFAERALTVARESREKGNKLVSLVIEGRKCGEVSVEAAFEVAKKVFELVEDSPD